jgi:hypothetical protein
LGFSWACLQRNSRTPRNSFEEYIAIEKLPLNITGFETQGEMQYFSWW